MKKEKYYDDNYNMCHAKICKRIEKTSFEIVVLNFHFLSHLENTVFTQKIVISQTENHFSLFVRKPVFVDADGKLET